jgi:hypothetical protein
MYHEKLYNMGLVSRKTIEDAQQKLRSTYYNMSATSYTDQFESVLQIGFEAGGNFLQNYWKPKEHVQDQTDYYVENYFKGHYVIGIQIRFQFLGYNQKAYIWKANWFLFCASQIEERHPDPNMSVRWLILDDVESVFNQIYATYSHKIIVVNGTRGNIAETAEEKKRAVYMKTILDNELLSRCDEMIVTDGSSFGFLSAMRKKSIPHVITRTSPKCQRAKLSTPLESF